jgi:hypothetical protein
MPGRTEWRSAATETQSGFALRVSCQIQAPPHEPTAPESPDSETAMNRFFQATAAATFLRARLLWCRCGAAVEPLHAPDA